MILGISHQLINEIFIKLVIIISLQDLSPLLQRIRLSQHTWLWYFLMNERLHDICSNLELILHIIVIWQVVDVWHQACIMVLHCVKLVLLFFFCAAVLLLESNDGSVSATQNQFGHLAIFFFFSILLVVRADILIRFHIF